MRAESSALTWRPLNRGDAEAAADLLEAIETVDRTGENYTAEDTLQELEDPYADLERGSLAAFDGDVMVGFMKTRYKPVADEIHRVFLDGLRVEPWSERNDEEFRMIRNESFKDHWGSAPMTVDAWTNKITNHTFRPDVSFLLRDVANGAAAGMLVTMYWEADTNATGVRDAHFMLIGTLRQYRKRGVASALIGHALRAAADRGYDRASLRVDSANPAAFGVYEKAGFVSTSRFVRWALEV